MYSEMWDMLRETPTKHPRKLKKKLKAIAKVLTSVGYGYSWHDKMLRQWLPVWKRALWMQNHQRELWWLANYNQEGLHLDPAMLLSWVYEYDNGLYCEDHYGRLDYSHDEKGKVMHEDLRECLRDIFYFNAHNWELDYEEPAHLPFQSDRAFLRWLSARSLPLPYGYRKLHYA